MKLNNISSIITKDDSFFKMFIFFLLFLLLLLGIVMLYDDGKLENFLLHTHVKYIWYI